MSGEHLPISNYDTLTDEEKVSKVHILKERGASLDALLEFEENSDSPNAAVIAAITGSTPAAPAAPKPVIPVIKNEKESADATEED